MNATGRILVLIVAGIGAACSSASEQQPELDPFPFFRPVKTAQVTGTVVTTTGMAVADAQITAMLFARTYDSGECLRHRVTGPKISVTNDAGEFGIAFNVGRTPTMGTCLRLGVTPPVGSNLEPEVIDPIPLELAAEGQPGREVTLEIILEHKLEYDRMPEMAQP